MHVQQIVLMVRPLLLFISSLLALTSVAQENTEDTVSVVRSVIPSIYVDYGKLLTIPSSVETKYEGGVELLFREKIPIILEVGSATLSPTQAFSNGTYEVNGTYFRVGTGILSQFQPKNKLGFTVRYGTSSFDEDITLTTESVSGIQPATEETIQRDNLKASWYEFVLYSDRRISDLLSVGMHLRYRILRDYDEQNPVDVYAIPGYGRSFDSSIIAVNFFVKVSF